VIKDLPKAEALMEATIGFKPLSVKASWSNTLSLGFLVHIFLLKINNKVSSVQMDRVNMVARLPLAGLIAVFLGLLIVIVQALNMSNLFGVEAMLRSLGLVLVGISLQLLGLGLIFVGKKKDVL